MSSALMALRTTYNYFMCSALVSPRGFKTLRTSYISCVPRFFRLVVFRTTYSSCAARLFGLMTERYFAFIPTSIAHSRKRDGSHSSCGPGGLFCTRFPIVKFIPLCSPLPLAVLFFFRFYFSLVYNLVSVVRHMSLKKSGISLEFHCCFSSLLKTNIKTTHFLNIFDRKKLASCWRIESSW